MVQRKKKKERTQRIQYTAGSCPLSKKEDPEEDSRQRAVARCLKKIPNKTGDSAEGHCLKTHYNMYISNNIYRYNSCCNCVTTKSKHIHPFSPLTINLHGVNNCARDYICKTTHEWEDTDTSFYTSLITIQLYSFLRVLFPDFM